MNSTSISSSGHTLPNCIVYIEITIFTTAVKEEKKCFVLLNLHSLGYILKAYIYQMLNLNFTQQHFYSPLTLLAFCLEYYNK